ncbi:MAG TPA: hypothetical protein VFT75_11060 [Nocardioidaceae bacterium]|jgi:hypothetical protein|nr:hypothetical protein [Nocardioidaceae bacterium]
MSLPPERSIASFDSASALLTALALALEGREFAYLGQSPLKARLVRASGALPAPLRRRVYALASGREGVAPERLAEVDLERVADWVVDRYRGPRFAGVLIGSSNGALSHLAAACGLPWLPQTLLVPVRRPGADPEDAAGALAFGERHAGALLDANKGVLLHHMHDPNQDELSTSQMGYFRTKWAELPASYRRFIEERLAPGAPVVVVRDTSTWPVTRVGERHVFQLGAQGGMSAEEYLAAPGAPAADDTAPEAEWGFAGPLLDGLVEQAQRRSHPVVEVRFEHPQTPSAAVADTVRSWKRSRGEPAQRLLVSSFIVHDPWRTLASGSVPFWTFFPTQRAALDLAGYLGREQYDEVGVMLFSHGVRSTGLVEAESWQRLAGRARVRGELLGADPDRFPADFATFAHYTDALRKLPVSHRPWRPLSLDDALSGLASAPGLSYRYRYG